MSEVEALYQALLLNHSRNPRNFGALAGATRSIHRNNPFCGDALTVHVKLSGDRIVDARFEGAGCAISMASASMMTISLTGKTCGEARALAEKFDRLVTGATSEGDELGELAVLGKVAEFPVRVECARLAWHALLAALFSLEDGLK
jgi:nitrogen fixation protein NifU and related proteins